jgi:hypothetical protein
LNFKRIAKQFASQEKTRPYRFALLGAALCTGFPIEQFLPSHLKPLAADRLRKKYPNAQKPEDLLRVVLADTEHRAIQHYRDAFERVQDPIAVKENGRAQELAKATTIDPTYERTDMTARIRYLMEGAQLEDHLLSWSMSGNPRDLVFNDGATPMDKYGIWEAFLDPKTDSKIKSALHSEWQFVGLDQEQCELLAKASVEELGALFDNCEYPDSPLPVSPHQLASLASTIEQLPKSNDRVKLPVSLEQCVQCHKQGQLLIPFHDISALKSSPWKEKIMASISPKIGDEKRMPRGKPPLSQKEYQEIASFLGAEGPSLSPSHTAKKDPAVHTAPLDSYFDISSGNAKEILNKKEIPSGAFLLKPASPQKNTNYKVLYKEGENIKEKVLSIRLNDQDAEKALQRELKNLQKEGVVLTHPVRKNGRDYSVTTPKNE